MDSEKLMSVINKKRLNDDMIQKILQETFNPLQAEKRAKFIPEKSQDSLRGLQKAQQNALTANVKVKTLEDKNKMLQEHNIKLENQLERATNANKNLADVGSEKLDALECLKSEKEARIVLEKKLDSLREELERVNEKVKTLEEENKMLQEHNTKLDNANKNLEREKDMILKYNITLEKLCVIYEAQIADAKDSGDDAAKQKETSEEN